MAVHEPYRGRFAPSPTGDLHLGCAATALVTWLAARERGGQLVLRVEDLDGPRVVAGSLDRQLDDLRWLGLDWDEGSDVGGGYGPYEQSRRLERYEAALGHLEGQDLLYYCDCSRAEIARVASAPHAGEQGPRYPGSCRERGLEVRPWRRPPAIRLRVPPESIEIDDRWQGPFVQDVAREVGDFVLRRGDGIFSYQFAVVVDDLAMEVTEVVRGADLLDSSPRQRLLAQCLRGRPPRFAHAPLVRSASGERLAKRAHGISLRHHREAGRSPREVVGLLARTLGLSDEGKLALSPRELLAAAPLDKLRGRAQVHLDPGLLLSKD